MGLNFGTNLFPPREELVNYDWVDIDNGLGYVKYYGFMANNGNYYTTTNSDTTSEYIKTQKSVALGNGNLGGTASKEIDLTFDITFATPKNVKGDIFVTVPIGCAPESATQIDVSYYAVVRVYHWDGSTETQLGSTATSTTYTHDDLDEAVAERLQGSSNPTLRINQATTKHFKAGETLRVDVEGWFSSQTGSAEARGIAHDPKNRGDKIESHDVTSPKYIQIIEEGQPTQLLIQVPFKLDI